MAYLSNDPPYSISFPLIPLEVESDNSRTLQLNLLHYLAKRAASQQSVSIESVNLEEIARTQLRTLQEDVIPDHVVRQWHAQYRGESESIGELLYTHEQAVDKIATLQGLLSAGSLRSYEAFTAAAQEAVQKVEEAMLRIIEAESPHLVVVYFYLEVSETSRSLGTKRRSHDLQKGLPGYAPVEV